MAESGDMRTAMDQAISNVIRTQDDSMVTNWVLCAAVIGADGEAALWALAPAGQKAWTSLGLLTYAIQCEQTGSVADRLTNDG